MWATPQVLVLTPSANTSAIEPSARIPLHQSHVIPLEKVWGCWRTSLILAMRRQRQVGLRVQVQPSL